MSLTELKLLLQELSRPDKLRAMQFLVIELAQEEDISLFEEDEIYPIWSSYNAVDAAEALHNALKEDEEKERG